MELQRLQEIVRLLEGEEPVVIVQPLMREGSVPTPVGALMIVHEDGMSGTVGGGTLEAQAASAARRVLGSGRHALLATSMDATLAAGDDMLCGGHVTLLLESVAPDQAPAWAAAEAGVRRGGELAWRCVVSDAVPTRVARSLLTIDQGQPVSAQVDEARAAGVPVVRRTDQGFDMIDPIVMPDMMLVFGAGHVAQALVPIAAGLGFRCVVVDDRADYASHDRFPAAHRLVVEDPAAAVAGLPAGPQVWAVIMTRGHKDDARVLARLTERSYRYVGMMGSSRKKTIIWEQLEAEGAPLSALSAVHCPIGLAIGGTSPQEIAVSIAAELVAVHYGRTLAAVDERGS
ncbi:MAG: XdhC family protein [Candidatus Eisenbacteria bacterium]|nr:XdhC family protein [Candidatus Eisenbacteria bacterium]